MTRTPVRSRRAASHRRPPGGIFMPSEIATESSFSFAVPHPNADTSGSCSPPCVSGHTSSVTEETVTVGDNLSPASSGSCCPGNDLGNEHSRNSQARW